MSLSRAFLVKPWIKNKVLNYINEEEYHKKPVRAQVMQLINSKEQLEPNELMSAEIHDNQHFIKCFFTNESLDDFERKSFVGIDDMRGAFIIIKDYEIGPYKHEFSLTIKRFNFTKNITEETEESPLKYICEEMEIKETLRALRDKPNPLDHPGWGEFGRLFYSNTVDIRTVPPDQLNIIENIRSNFSQRNKRINNVEDEPSYPSSCEESETESSSSESYEAISLDDEDIVKEEEKESCRRDTLDDDKVHFERTKRKYDDNDPDDDISLKKEKVSK